MKKYTYELIERLNNQLKKIDLEEENVFVKAPKAISLLENMFTELKQLLNPFLIEI